MKFETKDILMDKEVKDFLRAKPRRKSTESEHIIRLRQYCNFLDKKPAELIKEAEYEEIKRIRMKKRRIRKHFLDYGEHLRDMGLSHYTISNRFSSVKSFYRNAEIELPNITVTSRTDAKRARNESIPSKDDIRKALKHCSFKYQAIILLMSSSGMGAGEICNLTFGDFLDAIDEYVDYDEFDVVRIGEMLKNKDDVIAKWNVGRQKEGNSYYTFSSPESIKAIIDYLIERQKKQGIIESKDEPLFENFADKISGQSLSKSFQRINDDAGMGWSGRQRFFKSHSMRKYFGSILHKKGLSQITIDWFLGHEINGVDASYIKADPSHMKEEYLKVVEDLSIEKVTVKKVTTPEYDQLLKDSMAKDDKIASQDEKITQMEKKMELMDNMLKNVLEKQLDNEKGI